MNHKTNLIVLVGVLALAFAISSEADITAGIDFDVAYNGIFYTEPGYLSVPATGAKDYNVTHNKITFDIKSTYANLGMQNRYRTNAGLTPLTADFAQWYGRNQPGPVEVAITMTGLAANTEYELSFYMFNAGAGNTTHSFYEGPVAPENLLGTFTTAGRADIPANWVPNVDYSLTADSTGKIVVTIQGTHYAVGDNMESRLTFDGMSVTGPPIPTATLISVH